MSQSMRYNFNNLTNSWDEYLSLLNRAKLSFEEKQDELKQMVLNEQIQFKEEIEQFCELWEKHKKIESANAKLNSVGLYTICTNDNSDIIRHSHCMLTHKKHYRCSGWHK